jgi:hypothetical protein
MSQESAVLFVPVSHALKRALRIHAAHLEVPMNAIVQEALELHLAKSSDGGSQ